MVKISRVLFLVLAFVIIFISCSQDPTSVGSSLIPSKDKIGFAQMDSYTGDYKQTSSSFTITPKLGGSSYLLLGNTSYMQSCILLRWDIFLADSFQTAIKNGTLSIDKTWLRMRPRYTIGDSTSSFDFSADQIRSPWSVTGFTRDSANALSVENSSIKTSIRFDSVYTIGLSTSAIYNWLRYIADSTSVPRCYGIQLIPTSSTKKIQGFQTLNLVTSTSDSSETVLRIALNHSNSTTSGIKDTIVVYPSQYVHYIQKYVAPPKNGDIYCEGSYATEGKLYINFPAIPQNVVINKAVLTLTVDSTNTIDGTLKSDSIYVRTLGDSTANILSSDSTVYALLARSGNTYTANISWMIQKWINPTANYPNVGVTLNLTDMNSSAARIAFYGSTNPKKELRPRLSIYYIQKQ